jgi:thioesterase domain-containing protein
VPEAFLVAVDSYIPGPFGGKAVLLWPEEQAPLGGDDPAYGWSKVCAEVELIRVPGGHHTCVAISDHLHTIGAEMRCVLAAADPATSPPSTPATAPAVLC